MNSASVLHLVFARFAGPLRYWLVMRFETMGATIDDVMAAASCQAHTFRGAMTGALKKLGLEVTSEKVGGRGRVYRIA